MKTVVEGQSVARNDRKHVNERNAMSCISIASRGVSMM